MWGVGSFGGLAAAGQCRRRDRRNPKTPGKKLFARRRALVRSMYKRNAVDQ